MRIIASLFVCSTLALACGDLEGAPVQSSAIDDEVGGDDRIDDDVVEVASEDGETITEADLEGLPEEDDSILAGDDEDFGVAEPEPPEQLDALAPLGDDVRTRELNVLHWNIAGGKENNCAIAGIRRAVMRFVRDADGPVDFVSLNEVCPAQFQAIREALRKHWDKTPNANFAAFVASGRSRVGSAIFSRRGFRKITHQELGEDQFGKRFLLCGRHVDRRVRVCTAHLSPSDTKARVQIDKVRSRIEGWWRDQRDTVILAGDLNIEADDPGLNALYSSDANTTHNPNNTGAYRELDDDDHDHCRGYGERSHAGQGGPCGEGGKIDFIFARNNRIVNGNYAADSLSVPQDCTGACSDHRALRGTAKLRYRID